MSAEFTGRDLLHGRRPDSNNVQQLTPADITIWWLDLDVDDIKATRWFSGLTEDEQARANRFVRRVPHGGDRLPYALEGIKVVDVAINYAGPASSMYLADQGADVIKIERRISGDTSRRSGNTPFR